MRVLFVYPNKEGVGTIPLGISMMSSALKNAGHEVKVFDTTFFKHHAKTAWDRRGEVGSHLDSDLEKYIKYHPGEVKEEFVKLLEEHRPDLLALSVVSYNYQEGLEYLRLAKEYDPNIKTIAGGTHVNVAFLEVIKEPSVDMVCVGEGEEAIVELCRCLECGDYLEGIGNIWFKQDNEIKKNSFRPFSNLDVLDYPDFSIFDDSHFYKPFIGKVYRTAHLELSRGCPYQCTYCVNKHYQELFRGLGAYHREKSVEKSICEIKFLVDKYHIQMIKFWDETFLVMKEKKFNHFLDLYAQQIRLSFMINTRAETVTEKRVKKFKQSNCVAISVGIESGNKFIRRKVMKRNMSKEDILRAFFLLRKYGIRSSSFNMIGLPFETRKTVFETIKLNRQAKPSTCVINIFYPYFGTKLRDVCIDLGFMEKNVKMVNLQDDSVLDMPQMSKSEICSLHKTFLLYVKLPRFLYPLIYLSEFENVFARELFKLLINFMKKFYMEKNKKH